MTPKWGVQPVAAFKATMDAGVPIVMLDVRETNEWAEGIVEGSVLVSLTELPTAQGLAKLPLDKQTAMGVYCKSGHRSACRCCTTSATPTRSTWPTASRAGRMRDTRSRCPRSKSNRGRTSVTR